MVSAKVPTEEKQMRKLSVLLAGLLSAGLAHADLVTYKFTASFMALTESNPALGDTNVSSSILPGFPITVGDTLHGSFTLDTMTPLLNSSPSGSGTFNNYAAAAGQNAFAAIFSSNSYTLNSANTSYGIATLDQLPGQGRDAVYLGLSRLLDTGGSESLQLELSDASATALAYNHIPDSLTAFTQGTFRYLYTSGMAPHALGLTATGAITSLTLVSSVPEPATYMLLVAGLGLLAWRGQRNAKSTR
jgi:hypothetical protein